MKVAEKKKFKTIKPVDVYRDKIKALRKNLPSGFRAIIYKHYPEYNSNEGISLINNVISGASTEVVITEILERIASKELI
jgi:hypothetical protein